MKKIILLSLLFCIEFTLFAINSDTLKIKNHLRELTKTNFFRNHKNPNTLNDVAKYIYDELDKYSDSTYYQKYSVNGIEYKNVVSIFGASNKESIIIGAHYDVCGNQEGADDNASGVTGLLEIARMLKAKELNYKIEIVAYTLEEPPYFQTIHMGSYQHARFLKENERDIYGMISLEMIGYFDNTKKSQNYPIKALSLFYGNQGNYITLVNKFQKGQFARKFSNSFKKRSTIVTKKFTGPKALPGIDFSDHLNYWSHGFSALMITDTAFYRNKNYHRKTDKIHTLNIFKMSQVIDAVYETVINLE